MRTATLSTSTALVAFASLANAHFNLDYPAARGFDEDVLGTFPCGGQDTVSSNRTSWPLSGGSIALTMGHIDANVEVLIAVGSDPGSAFNTIIRPTFTEQGLGAFCMTGFTLPSSLNISDGTEATIQVVTNGDPDRGLYNCADITFSSTATNPDSSVCKNATGVTTTQASVAGNPNVTSSEANGTTNGAESGAVGMRVGVENLLLAALTGVVLSFAL
ncbi:uncharacterized protein LY89DRAFT_713960 [Mollisia scopiformis]|uniref:Copper acquisition factor BIM1-like domain-containing protein n=1 Tax=Mollisia scopiformis TaxID=149040 RepID=A0A194XT85_MOLSC|nr:uncharacterized protein LY89DRAFT_713960 [Mollisia scopiformis]KUJ23525.1 hypothetical protein LY89DRAFT_713960 [Mollisia scopiformis]